MNMIVCIKQVIDPEANIFKEARFGVVGDWKKVLPAFTAKVKELLAGYKLTQRTPADSIGYSGNFGGVV